MSNERKKYRSVQEIPITEVVNFFGIPFETQDGLIYAADCIVDVEANTFWDGSALVGDVVEFASLALECERDKAERFLEEKFVIPKSAPAKKSEVKVLWRSSSYRDDEFDTGQI